METKKFNSKDILMFVLYALFGIFMFFVPIKIGEANTIPIDHLTSFVKKAPNYNLIFGVFMVIAGIVYAIKTKSWKKSKLHMVFFALKSVTTIVPIGSVFLAFLTGFGLMEFIGVFMEPVMRPVFKTPGRSAVDAVASFVGSYSLALLITNRVYMEDTYTKKEAAIIATGFSTVSATFMIIVAKTLDLMDYWLAYFWITLIVTFIVTAITARIFPLNKKPQEYYSGKEYVPEEKKKVTFADALDAGMTAYKNADSLGKVIKDNFIDGFKMALNIAPSLLGVGMIGLLLAEYTPIFDIIGYIFYPFTLITKVEEPLMVAQALGMSIAEMLLPAPLVAEAGLGLITKMLVAIVSVSEILFFSASIPVMMGTEIPLKFSDYIIIWIERVILSIVISMPILYLVFR